MPTFDTLQYANTLEQAGASEFQAKVQTDALAQALESTMQDLATKNDLELATSALRGETKQLGTELRGEMKQLSAELRGELGAMRWILATLTAATITLVIKSFI